MMYRIVEMTPWPTFLSFHGTLDGIFRAAMVLVVAVLIVKYSTVLEEEYSKKLADLYIYPWWRILVVLLIVSSAVWCPRVGILVAVLLFFYLSDMNMLISPMTEL